MLSNLTGAISGQMSNMYAPLNTEPYDTTAPLNNTETGSPALDLALSPFSISMSLNSMRMSWKATRAFGITSSLANPYSIKRFNTRRQAQYANMAFKGLIGDTLNAISHVGDIQGTKDGALGWRAGLRRLSYSNVRESQYLATPGHSALDRILLPKGRFEKVITKVDPNLLNKYKDVDEAYDVFIKNLVSKDGKTSRAAAKKWAGKASKRQVSLMEILRGSRKSSNPLHMFGSRQKIDRVEELFGSNGVFGNVGANVIDPSTKRLRLSKKSIRGGMYNRYGASVNEAMVEFIKDGGSTISKESMSLIDDFTELATSRLRKARLLKGAAIGLGGVMAAVPLVATAIRGYMTIPTRVASTLDSFRRNSFGGGEVLQNSSVATERQRALNAIRDAQLNARSLMGNEASFMH
jgi:hypothetical protein